MADYLLTPPTVDEGFGQYERLTSPLWRYMQTEVAQSIVKLDGTWLVARIGSYPELSDLDAYYQGGSNYIVDQATRDDMVADGLGAYLTVITSDAYSEEVLADSPTVYLKFDDADPAVALVDSSGNGHDADALEGGTITQPGIVTGSAAGLSPDASYSAGVLGPLMDSSSMTLELWVARTPTSDMAIPFLAYADGGLKQVSLYLNYSGTTHTVFYNNTSETLTLPFERPINNGLPHHVVLTCDGLILRAYFDGNEVLAQAVTGSFISDVVAAAGSVRVQEDVFDCFALYDHALSASRVQAHYRAGVA